MRKAKPIRNNIGHEEIEELKNIKCNRDIKILKVDKGNETIILYTRDYHKKMIVHLTTSGRYKRLKMILTKEF